MAIPSNSRFRRRNRALSAEEAVLHQRILEQAAVMEGLFDQLGQGRHRSLAYTALEDSVNRALMQLTEG